MTLPKVLAGPLLRRVSGPTVAVWVALRDSGNVTLTVWPGIQRSTGPGAVDSGVPPVATGTAVTRRFGANLHVAVVVAEADGTVIAPGAIHSYDLTIDGANLLTLGLLRDEQAGARLEGVHPSAPLHLALGYELDRLPTFATAAPVLADLRFAHASCRRTNFGGPQLVHGPLEALTVGEGRAQEGPDALAFLDDIIEEDRSDPVRRPQQLFLTGDQIYADDLGGTLLPQVNALGRELLGFAETLPVTNNEIAADLANFPVMRRRRTVRELGSFTTSDGLHHLLSYGEFLAIHLLSWSPRLWRPLATPDDVFVPSTKIEAHHLQDWEAKYGSVAKWREAKEQGFVEEAEQVAIFARAVPRVARALAQIPTYMIFDDHEVTDDWFLSKSWRTSVVAAPFGRAVLRNAYAAYSVCQGWGNDPARFGHEGAAPKPKNEQLLDTLEAVASAGSFAPHEAALERLFGLEPPGKDPEVVFHYDVPGPRHLVRVLDTRTRRTFRSRLGPPNLLGNSLDAQLPPGPLTDGRELLIVVSPVPILFPRIFDALIQPLAARLTDFFANMKEAATADEDGPPITGNETLDVEGWGGDEQNLEAMIRRLGTYQRVIVLSGDVHFSSSLALDYWAGTDPTVDSRIVQLTSSGARNAANRQRQAIIRSARFSAQLLRGPAFERLGWTGKPSVSVPDGTPISPARRTRLRKEPGLLPAAGWPAGTTIPTDEPPDWRWRLTVLRDETPRAAVIHPEGLQPPLPAFNGADPLATYNDVAAVHAQLALSPTELLRTMVFRSNIGIIRFEPAGSDQDVVHELWSQDAPLSNEGAPFTKHRSSLALSPALPAPLLQVVPDA